MKSSGGNCIAGAVWSPSKSRTVWLYWLWVKRRSSASCDCAAARAFQLPIFQGGRQLDAGNLRQLRDPRLQDRFFRAARLNPLAAGMRNARSRLLQQKRSFRMFAIHQDDQRISERGDLSRRQHRPRENATAWPTRRPRIVAGAAVGLLQNRIKGGLEIAALRPQSAAGKDQVKSAVSTDKTPQPKSGGSVWSRRASCRITRDAPVHRGLSSLYRCRLWRPPNARSPSGCCAGKAA